MFMGKWKGTIQDVPAGEVASPVDVTPKSNPIVGTWFRIGRDKDHNGVRGWSAWRLEFNDGRPSMTHLHGPDLLAICEDYVHREVTRGMG